jgi:hypothetical protein
MPAPIMTPVPMATAPARVRLFTLYWLDTSEPFSSGGNGRRAPGPRSIDPDRDQRRLPSCPLFAFPLVRLGGFAMLVTGIIRVGGGFVLTHRASVVHGVVILAMSRLHHRMALRHALAHGLGHAFHA